MSTEKAIEEKLRLLEKELATLTGELDRLKGSHWVIDEMKAEIKALKVFLGRHYPDFKKELPEILKKV